MRADDKAEKRAVGNAVLADERMNSSQSAMCRILNVRCCKKHEHSLKLVALRNGRNDVSVSHFCDTLPGNKSETATGILLGKREHKLNVLQ